MRRWMMLVLAISLLASCTAESAERGTLRGTVRIGPLCPIEPCDPGEAEAAYIYRRVLAYREGRLAGETTIDPGGAYRLDLSPGTYTIDVTDAGGDALPLGEGRPAVGAAEPQQVVIEAGETARLDIEIDTGIR